LSCLLYATNCGDLHQAINALQGVGRQLLLPTFVLHATADKVTQYEVGYSRRGCENKHRGCRGNYISVAVAWLEQCSALEEGVDVLLSTASYFAARTA
jgi:hypothetical protein